MKRYIVLFIFIVLAHYWVNAQVETTNGLIEKGYLQIYLCQFNKDKDAHKAFIDPGTNAWPIIKENGKERYFQSPMDLILFMDKRGFEYLGVESYIENDRWYTSRNFLKR
jgi:hypothetical protein